MLKHTTTHYCAPQLTHVVTFLSRLCDYLLTFGSLSWTCTFLVVAREED
jgi:hypothetical protein